ncbi:MAG: bifunctional oligoribonuclease/PAP phosphatase NrnA [Promethearchaeota archaeon]
MFKELKKLLDKVKPRNALLLCHQNADPDAILSAFAFAKLLRKKFSKIKTELAAESQNKVSKKFTDYLNISLKSKISSMNFDIVFLLDTNNLAQLGALKEMVESLKAPIVIIDHHTPHPQAHDIATLQLLDESCSSTAEIIYRLYREAGAKITSTEAFALLAAMVYDSRRFLIAGKDTFLTVVQLTSHGANYSKVISLLQTPLDNSERIARFKAVKRMKLHKFDDWIVATSKVSAYEASACRALIDIGADIAIVGAEHEKIVRISGRARPIIYKRTGLHLGKHVMIPVGPIIGGEGGGHPTAAGCNGTKNLKKGMSKIIQLIKNHLTRS